MLKLSFKISVLSFILVLATAGSVFAQDTKCQTWNDVEVEDKDFAAFQRVCEYGYFRGNTHGNLRPESNLTRVETAVILNRIFGVSTDFDFESDLVGFSDEFFEEHVGDESYKWIYRAVKNSSLHRVNNVRVFSGYSDNTFKPLSPIKFAEFSKVILMGFQESGDAEYAFTYDFTLEPWYLGLQNLLTNFEGANALVLAGDLYSPNTPNGDVEFAFSSELTRRQAIVFLDALIEQGYLGSSYSYSGHDLSFSYPLVSELEEYDTKVSLMPSDGYVARKGIQRISAGLYQSEQLPSGSIISIPDRLSDQLRNVIRFESCDSSTSNCQVAYFFTLKGEIKPQYFLEVSYVQAKYSTAKKVIEEIYQSLNII